MNFSDFLIDRRKQKNITSSKNHFEDLGGKKTLGIEARQFQQIESGKYPPSEKVLLGVFRQTPGSQRNALLTSYFRSVLQEAKGSDELIKFLEGYLHPAIDTSTKSLWESGERLMTYSDEQLDYLINNPDALKFHKRVLLFGSQRSSGRLVPSKIKALEDLRLVESNDSEITPSRNLYRIPSYENSSPSSTARASDYIRKQLDIYLSREGSTNQEIGYTMQLVSKESARRILEQLKAFKKWIQSISEVDKDGKVPLIFIGFAKALEEREI